MQDTPFKFLDYPQVSAIVGLAKTPIRERIKAGTFPAPVALSSRCVRFRSDQITQWMLDQAAAADSSKDERTAKAVQASKVRYAKVGKLLGA